jgi:hypothetical protein
MRVASVYGLQPVHQVPQIIAAKATYQNPLLTYGLKPVPFNPPSFWTDSYNRSLRSFGKRTGQDALCRFIFFFVCFVSLYTLFSGGTMVRKTRAAAEIVMGNQPGSTPLAEAKPAGRDLVKGQYCN